MFEKVRKTLREYLPYTAAEKQQLIEPYRPYKAFVIPYEIVSDNEKQSKQKTETIEYTEGDKEDRKKLYVRIVIPELGYLTTKARLIPIHVIDNTAISENIARTWTDVEVGQPVIAIPYNDEYWIALPIIEQHAYNSNIPIEHNLTIVNNTVVKQSATFVDTRYETYIDTDKQTGYTHFYVPYVSKDKTKDSENIRTISITRKDFFDFALTRFDKQSRWYKQSKSRDFNQTFEAIAQNRYDTETVYAYQIRPMKLEYVAVYNTETNKPYTHFMYLYPSITIDFVYEPSNSEFRKRLSMRIKDTKQDTLVDGYTEYDSIDELKKAVKGQVYKQQQFRFGFLLSPFNIQLPYRHKPKTHFSYSEAPDKHTSLQTQKADIQAMKKRVLFHDHSIVDDKSVRLEHATLYYTTYGGLSNNNLYIQTDAKTQMDFTVKQQKQSTYTGNTTLTQHRQSITLQKAFVLNDTNRVNHFVLNTNMVSEYSDTAKRIGAFTTGYVDDINGYWNLVAGSYYALKFPNTESNHKNIDFANFISYRQVYGYAYTNNAKQIRKVNYTRIDDLSRFTIISRKDGGTVQQTQIFTDTTQHRINIIEQSRQTNLHLTNTNYSLALADNTNLSVIQGSNDRVIVALYNGDRASAIELTPGKAKIIARGKRTVSVTVDGNKGTIVYTNGINSIVIDENEIAFYEKGRKKMSIGLGGGDTVIATNSGYISISDSEITLAHEKHIRIAAPTISLHGYIADSDYTGITKPNLTGAIQQEDIPIASISKATTQEDVFNPEKLE